MRFARHYDRHDQCSCFMTSSVLVLYLVSPSVTLATPVKPALVARQNDNDSRQNGLAPSTWIPIVVALLVFVGFALLSWSNRRIRQLILPATAVPSSQAQGIRELTADELTGTINNVTGTTNTTVPQPTARTRRSRRPRRTPSQMSVTSLPEYNKEPGEQELVIFRGQDMEDATIPEADDSESSLHSRDVSQSSVYSHAPSLNDTPLLGDDNQILNRHSRRESRSHALLHSSEEGHGLMENDPGSAESPEPRGEAPPYFEVIDTQLPQDQGQSALSSISSGTNQPVPNTTLSPPERRSGIRTFFNRMSVVGAPRALGHARAESNTSFVSSSQSHGTPSLSTSHHGPSPSAGNSFFRTLSCQRSQSTLHSANASNRLNSPSLISLNSISSPLTHTLTRTEFTYPKTGPTPEQLKIISSREAITRFGVPYGPDALAFASSSMFDLSRPPPDFDTAVGASSSSLNFNTNASRVSLHTRGESAGARMISPLAQQEHEGDGIDREQLALSSNAAQSLLVVEQALPNPSIDLSIVATAARSSVISKAHATFNSLAASTLSNNPSPTVSEFGKMIAPPSSFNFDQTASSSCSECRASVYSYQSYATAAESIAARVNGVSTPADDESGEDLQEPQTPIVSPKTSRRN